MATEKVTPMVLKVDLQCYCCYKKIKKTLCKFPQIRDQVFDEKNNTVSIIVVCCSPEKIRDKLCSKAGKVIKGIDIKDSAKPKEPEKKKDADKPKEPPKEPSKPKEPEKPKVVAEKPKETEKKVTIIENPEKPKSNGKADKPKSDGAPPAEKPKDAPKMDPAKILEPAAKPAPVPVAAAAKGPDPVPVNGVPSVFPYLGPSYDAYGSGPYYHGYGFPPPQPQPSYDGYYGYGASTGYGPAPGYGYGYGRVGQPIRSDCYFSEENPQGCFIM
ncbi:protein PYRICULARIA ORYZAE RESISTANCE 21 [Andrographis paniculata]|uniref:protein PYRICULARIA ORYZAE RESISTANCE 21 n=1 Tax=Andrographis paniculata TaxID=175694 RepID=UPI0021E942D7|nr:protein PYRICULARIA ORYZAE RESISTANCE 21 [Andrographis paniculata]XP_051135272.1 protein PYRICULARIA ORYZAE RESISTANCE 21 [Andrographis paniculata]XP_051135273.1 protein PYRICULARIA ORYZAE RESISTANCE 21 [Andrographis paniculata]